MKNTICIITGILGTAVAALFGGWDGKVYENKHLVTAYEPAE